MVVGERRERYLTDKPYRAIDLVQGWLEPLDRFFKPGFLHNPFLRRSNLHGSSDHVFHQRLSYVPVERTVVNIIKLGTNIPMAMLNDAAISLEGP